MRGGGGGWGKIKGIGGWFVQSDVGEAGLVGLWDTRCEQGRKGNAGLRCGWVSANVGGSGSLLSVVVVESQSAFARVHCATSRETQISLARVGWLVQERRGGKGESIKYPKK